jgi:hypothetical protein
MEYIYEIKSETAKKDHKRKPITFIKKGECHLCTSHHLDKDNYAKISYNFGKEYQSTTIMLHKFVFTDTYMDGMDKTKGKHVLHKCNNHSCINPEHLYLGEQKDHIPKLTGEQHGQSKLTEKEVLAIRKDIMTNNVKLGKKYGVSDVAIRKIKKRITWTHI